MTRYLTPPKIGLLAIIHLYLNEVVPKSATIPILSFLIAHLVPRPPTQELSVVRSSAAPQTKQFIISLDDFQKLLIEHTSDHVGRTLWDRFLNFLWDINSFYKLQEFFAEEGILTEVKIPLGKNSPLDVFVRRCKLEYTRIQFHDAAALWRSFMAYREPSLSMWSRRHKAATGAAFDINLIAGGIDAESPLAHVIYGSFEAEVEQGEGLVSTDDIEGLLEFQVEEMQRTGSLIPDESKKQLDTMLRSNVTTPSLHHYVKFLESWRSGDYHAAFDNLHRYFDYTMQNKDRTFYHYALLNLAILQADFGCFGEALAAMHETIAAARENKDMGCLNFSLSWLYHFSKAHPEELANVKKSNLMGVEKEGLSFLKIKARESSMWGLWSLSLISEAKLGLTVGESIPSVMENLLRSSYLSVTKNITNTVSAQMMVQSAMWSRLGITTLAQSYCDIFLDCYAFQAQSEDVLKFVCKSALILAQKGKFEEAIAQLDKIDGQMLKSLRLYQYWSVFSGMLKLKKELHQNNLAAAEQLLNQLSALSFLEPEIATEVIFERIDLSVRRRDYAAALDTIEELFKNQKKYNGDILFRVRLMMLKATVLSKCGRAERGFSVALRAATLAWRGKLLGALWEAVGTLANVLIHLREYAPAIELIEAILPQVLEMDDAYLSARCFSWLADGYTGLAGASRDEAKKRNEGLNKALECVKGAFDGKLNSQLVPLL
jgi:anaphase-promoting complex subunit 5